MSAALMGTTMMSTTLMSNTLTALDVMPADAGLTDTAMFGGPTAVTRRRATGFGDHAPLEMKLPGVVYLDDVLQTFSDDGTGLPPIDDDDDDHGDGIHCVYEEGGYADEDDDFANVYGVGKRRDYGCREQPEYYIKALPKDPGNLEVDTYYYCPRHFALNLGFLVDEMTGMSPEDEMERYLNNGEIPPRFAIQEWGRIGE
ncbi:hypothetical protein [Bifidobacterium leontopitheci]|uniref:Uncharacterized protein n=1 Tax=Bifidobacterium leontopitheci TaxID=2650774 RepID=A0A6I1GFS2_9BIFI|nr:hypothetical protein [Bifidobacterium leontopitheci]KAB7790490.1 hypothetical protein F7D09_0986 [Bifidobacterium leontopitheci]